MKIKLGEINRMRKLNPPKKHSEILKKKYWSVQDLFWLLLGDFGFKNVIPIVQGEHSKHKELSKKLKEAADQGRFGFLLNTETNEDPVGIPFSWGVEYPEHGFSDQHPEYKMNYERDLELLRFLSTFCIHPMRIIDWVESVNIPSLIGKTQSRELLKLIENFRTSRKEDLIPSTHSINWKDFALADFWVKTELWLVLFGQTKACRYSSKEYWLFDLETERVKDEIDQFINNATKLKKVKAYPMKNLNWEPLIPHNEYAELCDVSDYYNYVGFYENDEANMSSHMYSPFELIRLIRQKGYRVPDGLLEAYQGDENRNNIIDFLKKLQENILSPSGEGSTVPKNTYSTSNKSPSSVKRGRSTLPAKQAVMQEALKIRKKHPAQSVPKIARHSSILRVLLPDTTLPNLNDLDSEEYKKEFQKRFNTSLRTVEGWIREAFKQNSLS
jgi:hypothetical protein